MREVKVSTHESIYFGIKIDQGKISFCSAAATIMSYYTNKSGDMSVFIEARAKDDMTTISTRLNTFALDDTCAVHMI